MSKSLWNTLLASSTLLVCASAKALSQISYSAEIPTAVEVAKQPASETSKEASSVPPALVSTTMPKTQLGELEIVKVETPTDSTVLAQTAEGLTPAPASNNASAVLARTAEEPLPAAASEQGTSIFQQIEEYNLGDNPDQVTNFEQVTNVSQLSDVQPTDWAYEALRSLVERYGCIAGYPNSTFRGNRALSRYEFAAGVNACLIQIEKLVDASTGEFVTKEDLTTLQRLVDEFGAELATLRTQVDNLEGRVTTLEENQFSTTTKLEGEAIFGLASIFTGEDTDGDQLNDVAVFGHRTRLNLETSFTGEDLLRTRLATGNFPALSDRTGTPEGELAFAQPEDNDVSVEVLLYSFPISKSTEVVIAAAGGASDDFASTVNFLDGDGASGALSAFGTRHPIYYLVDGAGLGIRQQLGKSLELSLGYLAGEANDPSSGNGLFNGSYSALAQLVFKPTERLNVGLTFIHSYKTDDSGTGSGRVSFARFDDDFFAGLNLDPRGVPTVSNSYGLELSWQLSDRIVVGGWVGYTNTRLFTTVGGLFDPGELDIFNYAVTLAFPDLGKKGNLAGIIVGMEPKVTHSTISSTNPDIDVNEDDDTSLHIEAFYQYQLTDNIAITPGIIWLTAPDFNNNNQDIVVGTLRTTLSF